MQFTREPDGIAGALKKIGGMSSKIQSAKASEASHCFFADGGLFAFGLATHPPLKLRIGRIQKSWDGEFSEANLPAIGSGASTKSRIDGRVSGLAGGETSTAAKGAKSSSALSDGKGNISESSRVNVPFGRHLLLSLPIAWKEAVHNRDEAQALVFGLLLAQDKKMREEEVASLRSDVGPRAAELALKWQNELGKSHSAHKIALIDLAIPTLRRLSRLEYDRFLGVTRALITSDGRLDVFEFMLQRLLEHHLDVHFSRQRRSKIRYYEVSELEREGVLLLSAFAYFSEDAEAVFEKGREGWLPAGVKLMKQNQLSLKEIDEALKAHELAAPNLKKELLEGCARTVAGDGKLTSREAELLRAMADSMGCGIPPWIEELKKEE